MTTTRMAVLCLGSVLIAVAQANAATISRVSAFSLPGFSTGTSGPYGNTPVPNNDDDPGASPNVIPYSVFLNSPGFLETEFILDNSGGTTEYRFTQNFINTRSAPWTGFRFELGYGLGGDFAASAGSDLLQFDQANGHSTATSPVFALTLDSPKILEWSVGHVPLVTSFTFAVDVPDGLASANPSGLNQFTLRQTPLVASAVPEPGTVLLAALTLAGMMLRLWLLHRA